MVQFVNPQFRGFGLKILRNIICGWILKGTTKELRMTDLMKGQGTKIVGKGPD